MMGKLIMGNDFKQKTIFFKITILPNGRSIIKLSVLLLFIQSVTAKLLPHGSNTEIFRFNLYQNLSFWQMFLADRKINQNSRKFFSKKNCIKCFQQ